MLKVSRYCPNCGAEVSEGASFCSSCGKAISQDAPQQTQQATSGTAPTAQMATPQQQQQPVFTPPQAPPSGGGGSRKGLLLGGLAVAGVLGFIVLLIVGALIFFLVIGSGEQTGTDSPSNPPSEEPSGSEPSGSEPSGSEPVEEPPPAEPPPESGSLESLIPQQVGDFELQQIEEIPEAIDAGATDARQMLYVSPDGVEALHQLSAWTSADAADQPLQGFTEELTSAGYEVVDEVPLTDDQGNQQGTLVALAGETEVILWTNRELFALIETPEGYALDFYENLPY